MTKRNRVESEPAALYTIPSDEKLKADEDAIIESARNIIKARFGRGATITTPIDSAKYLHALLAGFEHEVFALICLDNRNRVLGYDELFRGTIDGSSVYPREVVKAVLQRNAAAVILAHNHPSGVTEPSQADIRITERLKKALALIDVRLLDHIIIGDGHTSLSERGLV